MSETRIVSPMPRLMSCSKAMRVLMMPSGGMPASVTPRCSGTSGRCFGEAAIDFDHFARIGVLQRDAVAREAELVEQLAMLQRAVEHRRDANRAGSYFSCLAGSTLPQLTPMRMAQSLSPRRSTMR